MKYIPYPDITSLPKVIIWHNVSFSNNASLLIKHVLVSNRILNYAEHAPTMGRDVWATGMILQDQGK